MGRVEAEVHRDIAEREQFNDWFREENERLQREREASHTPSMAIIAEASKDMGSPYFAT